MAAAPGRPLNVLHVLRAPVGGLFRHVVDLAGAQAARGHRVGIVADATTGGARAEAAFAALAPRLALGVSRVAMSRHIGPSDLAAVRHVAWRAADARADVVHGHGAKGGAYARLAATGGALRVYTPHGGSLHYGRTSPVGLVYLTLERILAGRTDLFLFESAYGRDAFAAKIGAPEAPARVIHNGVAEPEFVPVPPAADADDLVFVGELRRLKGVDVLIDAIGRLAAAGRTVTATIVGDGPDAAAFRKQAESLGLVDRIRFPGAMPAREAFARGRLLVMASRAESLPYVVLEAAAAGLPIVSTRVGGIPEIFGPMADRLIPPADPAALAAAVASALDEPAATRRAASALRERVHAEFSVTVMADSVSRAYGEAMAAKAGH